jgi:hypothetical protein
MENVNTLEEVAFAYVLNRGNLRYDEERNAYLDVYTGKKVEHTDWILPASYAVAAILADALFEKYHRCDFRGLTLMDLMDRCGVRNPVKFYRRLAAAVDKYRLLDDRTEGVWVKKYCPDMNKYRAFNFIKK